MDMDNMDGWIYGWIDRIDMDNMDRWRFRLDRYG
jgi:hypothetical protein